MDKKEKNKWGNINYKDVIGPIENFLYNINLSNGRKDMIYDMWAEPHRYYHGPNHLSEIFDLMRKHGEWTPEKGYNLILFYSAIFHDIVYDPTRDDNEEKSVEVFESYAKKMIPPLSPEDIRIVSDIIMDTKTGISRWSDYSKKFIFLDRYNLLYGSFNEVLSKTMLLFKEEQFMNFPEWKEKTIKFLSQFEDTNPNIKYVIDYLNMWTPKIGVYSGSFNKLHIGHYNILQKSERIFDKVIIARGINTDKKNEIHDLPEILKYHQIEKYDGLLTDFIDSLGYEVVLIRGLRNSNDFENEKIQYQYLQDLKPDLNVVNIICDKEFEHISSSAIRTLEKFGKGGNYLLGQFD